MLQKQFYDWQEETERNTAYSSSNVWQLSTLLQVPTESERALRQDLYIQDPAMAKMIDLCRVALSADSWVRISPVLRQSQLPMTSYDLKFVPYADWKLPDNSPEWMAGMVLCRVELDFAWDEAISVSDRTEL